jgi:hypothetical protein
MREWACLATISIIGLSACAHHSVQPEHASVTSAPSPSAPPPVVTEPPSPAPTPIHPTAAATPPPPVDETAQGQSQPITPASPKPPAAANKPTPSKASAKPSATKPAKENATPSRAPIAPAPVAADVPTPPPMPPKPQLDLKAMEQRLRNTSAIGVFTKLSIKNQVDDLLAAFRSYHAGRKPPTLDDLHQRYDGLLLKVVSLVQDDDPQLAASISASRSAIWERLSNRESFQSI